MNTAHLDGKRTGRPRGTKSTPAWARDAKWAFRHFNDPDAVPPSEFARCLRDQARQRPDLLLAVLAQLELVPNKKEASAPQQSADEAPSVGEQGQREPRAEVKTFDVPVADLVTWAMGYGEPGGLNLLPPECEILSVVLNRRNRRVALTISVPNAVPNAPRA
jgi:hypothetical protein